MQLTAALLAFISSFDEPVVAMFPAGSRMTLPWTMFDNIMPGIDPTIAIVSVPQIILAGPCMALMAICGRGLAPAARHWRPGRHEHSWME